MSEDETTESEQETSEVIADAPAGLGRKKAIVFGALAAVLLMSGGAGGWLLLGGEEEAVIETGPTPEELAAQAERDRRLGRVDGIDYAQELDIEMPDDDVASAEESAEAAALEKPGHIGKIFSLEPFVVNISDGDRDRYLKLKADLELSADNVSDELDQRLPQVRDLIISMLGGKSFEDIRTIEGKNFLREEILLRINSLLVTGKAKRVFFTEFVVQ